MGLTLSAFWKFSRPHTIYGTSISLIGIFLIASAHIGGIDVNGLLALLVAEISCLCANVYIVGLNQITDVEIDRINKPYLPIASGEISAKTGTFLVGLMAIAALAVALAQNRYLFATVLVSILIGTAYSLPPLRLKRFPLFASLCIFTVRGLIVNLGIYWYFQDIGKRSLTLTPAIVCLSLFITLFTLVIAIFKDIPDMEGDRQFNISTFSLQLGQKAVFELSCALLIASYLLITVIGSFYLKPLNSLVLVTTHLVVIALFLYQRNQVDLKSNDEIYDFYQFIWRLYYLEYILLPVVWIF